MAAFCLMVLGALVVAQLTAGEAIQRLNL